MYNNDQITNKHILVQLKKKRVKGNINKLPLGVLCVDYSSVNNFSCNFTCTTVSDLYKLRTRQREWNSVFAECFVDSFRY